MVTPAGVLTTEPITVHVDCHIAWMWLPARKTFPLPRWIPLQNSIWPNKYNTPPFIIQDNSRSTVLTATYKALSQEQFEIWNRLYHWLQSLQQICKGSKDKHCQQKEGWSFQFTTDKHNIDSINTTKTYIVFCNPSSPGQHSFCWEQQLMIQEAIFKSLNMPHWKTHVI